MISGEASDYVFEKVRESLNVEALGATEKAIALRIRDDADDDIAAFVNSVLKEPQARLFRRAIVYVPPETQRLMSRPVSENSGDFKR